VEAVFDARIGGVVGTLVLLVAGGTLKAKEGSPIYVSGR